MKNAKIAMDFVNEIESTFKQEKNKNYATTYLHLTHIHTHTRVRSNEPLASEVSKTVEQPKKKIIKKK